jgi:exoribonuclease-2
LKNLQRGSLVLYKHGPARVRSVGKKIDIALPGGEIRSVRLKDFVLLHPGPIESLNELKPQEGEVQTAWELLSGSTVGLADLAELAYGAYTPATSWAAWQLVTDGLYFSGNPEEIVVHTPEEVAAERADREARAAEDRAWAAFVRRAERGDFAPDDARYLDEVASLGMGQVSASRVLRTLGRAESAENAHAFLLELGYWDHTVVPYPHRLGLPTAPPSLPESFCDLSLPEEDRRDLTHLPAFAIDDEGCQDPDDALSLESTSDGYRLWVHSADVAALVSPDSAVDLEARARGSTLYMPDGNATMLPNVLLNKLGMGLTDPSPALSFGLDLDARGQIVGVEILPAWVRVTRLTYAEAEARLEEEPFGTLYRLALDFRTLRWLHGAVRIDLPEVKVKVQDGEVLIEPLPDLGSRKLVREAMLMAGEAAARFSIENEIPFAFATQPPPTTDERPTDLAGMFALRFAMQPSQRASIPAPHAGLGMDLYAQATSPLRRYLDLVVHQQLRAHLSGEGILDEQEVLSRIGEAEAVARDVRWVERLVHKHWKLVYLMQHPDWQGEGVVVEKRDRRARVLVPELELEPWVHLPQDLPLNACVDMSLADVDLPRLEAYFNCR